jgi:hypothetical protein
MPRCCPRQFLAESGAFCAEVADHGEDRAHRDSGPNDYTFDRNVFRDLGLPAAEETRLLIPTDLLIELGAG